jgi:hypothetical protein
MRHMRGDLRTPFHSSGVYMPIWGNGDLGIWEKPPSQRPDLALDDLDDTGRDDQGRGGAMDSPVHYA